eukprot:7142572-Prorocentrum_lima.AAC.1
MEYKDKKTKNKAKTRNKITKERRTATPAAQSRYPLQSWQTCYQPPPTEHSRDCLGVAHIN